MHRNLLAAEVCAAAADCDVITDDNVFHATPAFEAVVATDPKTMREGAVDMQTGLRHHAASGVYAVVIPCDDFIGLVRTGDAIAAPRIFKTLQSVRPNPCLRINAFAQARRKGHDLTAYAACAMFENGLLCFELIRTKTRRRRHRPGTVLVRTAPRLITSSCRRFELFHHALSRTEAHRCRQRCLEWPVRDAPAPTRAGLGS